MGKLYCTYFLSDPRDNICRYVGKTIDGRLSTRLSDHLTPARLKSRTRRTNWIKSLLLAGVRPTIQLLEDKLTEEEAFDSECFFISYFRYLGFDLVNLTDGGEGHTGYKHTEETKALMRLKRQGSAHPMFGKKLSPESRRKISDANKGRLSGAKNPFFGKTHTAEVRQRISEANIGKCPWNKGHSHA